MCSRKHCWSGFFYDILSCPNQKVSAATGSVSSAFELLAQELAKRSAGPALVPERRIAEKPVEKPPEVLPEKPKDGHVPRLVAYDSRRF